MTAGAPCRAGGDQVQAADLPVGLSIAMADDVGRGRGEVVGTGSAPRSTTTGFGWRGGRLHRRAELRAHPLRPRRPASRHPTEPSQPDGHGRRPGSLGGPSATPISRRPARPGHRARCRHRGRRRARDFSTVTDRAAGRDRRRRSGLGYCHWTMLDNFEWVFGYATQLGLHEVDRETFARTAKPSAAEYARLVRSHRVAATGVRDDEGSR